ncbi:MAG: hypothetical protein HN509_08045 [Halobacteriovoraceae bacterium]|jgi:hypothetical protein|nr:hypothetical protein [Halobacteriovoraceae bacterium]MBT5094500.1 hypothetical protein [Halobacteriovoraceae bacterium]
MFKPAFLALALLSSSALFAKKAAVVSSMEEVTCSQMLMESAKSYADYTKQVDQVADLENEELGRKGIRPVAKYLPPVFIHPEVEKAMMNYIMSAQKLSANRNAETAKLKLQKNLKSFNRVIWKRAPKYMSECRKYISKLTRDCLSKNSSKQKSALCTHALNKRMRPQLMSHLPLSIFKSDLDKANILDDRISRAVKKDNPRLVKKLLLKRIKIKQNYKSAIPLIMHEAMANNSTRVMRYLLTLRGFHKISSKYFKNKITLLEQGIRAGSEASTFLYLNHKTTKISKKDARKLLKLASGYRRLKIKKILEKKLNL